MEREAATQLTLSKNGADYYSMWTLNELSAKIAPRLQIFTKLKPILKKKLKKTIKKLYV